MLDYQTYTLENGIRIIHKQSNRIAAHCGVFINAGSRDEKDKEQGLAHFIEHTIFKGTTKRKAYHVLSRIESVGGEINAYTTKEDTVIYASFLNKHYKRCLELFADILFHSSFPEKELQREKEVIIDEINSYKDSPAELIFDDYEELLFKDHPIGRDILGKPKYIKTFSKKHIHQFIEENYNPEEIVICSVGKISFHQLIKWITLNFSDYKGKGSKKQRQKFTSYQVFNARVRKKTFQTHCIIGNEAFSYAEKEKTELVLLNNLLGGPALNSRLNMLLREKHGLSYNIESNYTPYSDTGIFCIYLGTAHNSIDKAMDLVLTELKKIREIKLGSLQLHQAKQQLLGQIAISLDSDLNEMLSSGKSTLIYNKIDSYQDIAEKINAVSASDLMKTANTVFDPNKISTLIYF
jgi:predicted Zn-dependent peptidase